MHAGAADFGPFRFSTRGVPERERIPLWREEIGRSPLRVDIDPLSDVPFHADATLRAPAGLRRVAYAGSVVRLERTRVAVADAGTGWLKEAFRGGRPT